MDWRNLGIIPVFSAGAAGPNPGTAATPANYPLVIGVGSTDQEDNIAYFSGRGPAPNQPPWNDTTYWPRDDWNLTKPDISAPGVNIRSSWPNGGYFQASFGGTPHITGAIAILFQKNPFLDFGTVYSLLLDYANQPSQGAPYPNNNYGWGRLNVYRSLLSTSVEEKENRVTPYDFKIIYSKNFFLNSYSHYLKNKN